MWGLYNLPIVLPILRFAWNPFLPVITGIAKKFCVFPCEVGQLGPIFICTKRLQHPFVQVVHVVHLQFHVWHQQQLIATILTDVP